LCSTVHSKSILRAVAGALAREYDDIDYFPSYELVATPFVGSFYDDSKRNVTDEGIEMVMNVFFQAHGDVEPIQSRRPERIDFKTGQPRARPPVVPSALFDGIRDELICEEILLEAFAP